MYTIQFENTIQFEPRRNATRATQLAEKGPPVPLSQLSGVNGADSYAPHNQMFANNVDNKENEDEDEFIDEILKYVDAETGELVKKQRKSKTVATGRKEGSGPGQKGKVRGAYVKKKRR